MSYYIPEPFGRYLRRLRLTTGKKQKQLERSAEMPPGRLSNLEAGWRQPTSRELDLLAKSLGVPRRSLEEHLEVPKMPGERELLKRFRRNKEHVSFDELYEVHKRLLPLRKKYREATRSRLGRIRRRADRKVCNLWLGRLPTDSCDELVPWIWLLGEETTLPRCLSLEQIDFNTYPVADKDSGRDLKAVIRCCLEIPLGHGGVALLFPQVPLQTPTRHCRVDILVELIKEGRRATAVVEVDGDGHDSTFDLERDAALHVPVLHRTPRQLATDEGMRQLLNDLEGILD